MTLHITWTPIHNFITVTLHVNTWQLSPVLSSSSSSLYMQVAVLTWKLCVCVCVIRHRWQTLSLSHLQQRYTSGFHPRRTQNVVLCVVILCGTAGGGRHFGGTWLPLSALLKDDCCQTLKINTSSPPKHLYPPRIFDFTTHKIAVVAAVVFMFQHNGT